MTIKIIVDTNMLAGRNSFNELFGNRKELERILTIPGTELVVPSIVLDEVMHQKLVAFETTKSRLIDSSYYKKRISDTIKASIEADIIDSELLRQDVSIPYTLIDILDKSTALDKIRQLSVGYLAPFQVYSDNKDNSDKGFKDAYIALTIDQYIDRIDVAENVFLLTKDTRLAEYFQYNRRVVRVQSFDEINSQIEHTTPKNTDAKHPSAGTVKPLSSERIATQSLLTDFRNSGSFSTTHNLVAELVEPSVLNKLTDADYLDILVSTAQNDQISWLLGDTDVREFILPIFNKYGKQLSTEQYNIIAPGLGLEVRKVSLTSQGAELDDVDAMLDSWIDSQFDIERGR